LNQLPHRELIAYQDAFVLYYLILATIGLVFIARVNSPPLGFYTQILP